MIPMSEYTEWPAQAGKEVLIEPGQNGGGRLPG